MDIPDVPQQQQVPQGADSATMLASMGQAPPGIVQQGASADDAGMKIQHEFVDLGTGLQQWMKKITDLATQFPAFGPHAQAIAQAAMSVNDELNQGMMECIQQLRQQEPQAPPAGY
jgi:hypothetical protein